VVSHDGVEGEVQFLIVIRFLEEALNPRVIDAGEFDVEVVAKQKNGGGILAAL